MSLLHPSQVSGKPISHQPAPNRQAQQERRVLAATRISQGEQPSQVAASLGMSRAWAYQCYAALQKHGPTSLSASSGGGRPCKLTPMQQDQIFGCLNGKRPDQCDLAGSLWTQQRVQQLVYKRLGVTLSILTVAKLLSRLGLSHAKPGHQMPMSVNLGSPHGQPTVLPALAEQARAKGADLLLGNLHACGQTSSQQFWAVNLKGAFWFSTCPGDCSAAQFVTMMKRLMRGRNRPVCLLLGPGRWDTDPLVQNYLKTTRGRLTLHCRSEPVDSHVSTRCAALSRSAAPPMMRQPGIHAYSAS
jgi:transposase